MSTEDGLIALRDFKWAEAISIFGEAIRVDPTDNTAWSGRGAATMGEGRYLDALLHFETVLGRDPRHVPSLNHRGVCFMNLRWWEMAERSFMESISVRPTL